MPVMDPDRHKDLGEMYSPDDQGEYTSLDETPQFLLQGLSDTLADIGEETGKTSMEEYALLLEVTMADCPGRPHPPAFSWNVGMVMHILKSDPVLRELEHVQVDSPGTAYLFFYDKQSCQGLEQGATDAIQTNVEEAFLKWISCSAHFNVSLLPLTEAWWQSVAASDHRRLRSWAENPAYNAPVGVARESDSSSQLVGSAPQQDGRTSGIEERTEARPTGCTGAVNPRGRPPRTQCTIVCGGGLPPSSPDRGAPDSNGYSTVNKTVGHWHRHRGHRGSRERKRLAPVRLDMPIFKLTNLGAEVTYTLWHFNVDAFLEQYDEASMHPHIFASFRGYLGKWAYMLDEGKDISVQDLLMHMERTFGNKRDYDAMINTLYEVQQRDDEMVEEYMLCIHEAVTVICRAYPDHLMDRGQDLKKDCFYHGLCPYLHDTLSFAMVELPEREQACPTFDTLYTLAKKLEAGQLVHACRYTPSFEVYRDKHRCYIMLTGWVAALEEEGSTLSNQVTGEDSESEVEVVGGISVCLAQAMSRYQQEEQQCFMCGSLGHFTQDCPHCEAFRRWHQNQTGSKGAGENGAPVPEAMSSRPEVNVRIIGQVQNPWLEAGGPTAHWLGPEMLVGLTVEGRNFTALADSGSQVNTITPTLVQQYRFPVLPLEDLVDYPVNLLGLGGMHTSPLRFVILRIQVQGIAGYDEDAVFLVVPNESDFGRRVPLVMGTCTISRLINVICESEIDNLATPLSTARLV